MTEGEARRQDDVAGARAEAERYRVSVDCPVEENQDNFAHQNFWRGSAIGCFFHHPPCLPLPCSSPSNIATYFKHFMLRCSARPHALFPTTRASRHDASAHLLPPWPRMFR